MQPPKGGRNISPAAVLLLLAAAGILSFFLNTYNNDLPLNHHPDEKKKVNFISKSRQDFKHPILMIQINRMANMVLKLESKMDVLMLGRNLSAVFGTVITVATFFLARRVASPPYALLAALATAVSPVVVIHAHYYKEDIIFTAAFLLALLAYLHFMRHPVGWAVVPVGLAMGLAASAHYKGFLLLPFFSIMSLASERDGKRKYFTGMLASCLLAVLTFVLINWPLVANLQGFRNGLLYSSKQALKGSVVTVSPLAQYFSFHIRYSIIPGMTLVPALVSMAAMVWLAFRYRSLEFSVQVLFWAVLVFYLAVELSPMKAFPDVSRYVIPVIPLLLIISFSTLEEVFRTKAFRIKFLTILVMCFLMVLPPASVSARLLWNLDKDTRSEAQRYLASKDEQAYFESYSGDYKTVNYLSKVDISSAKEKGIRYLVASSFAYDRFYFGARQKSQHPDVYLAHRKYEKLFRYPYVEFAPAYKSFAFSNPTIRIVEISGEAEEERPLSRPDG